MGRAETEAADPCLGVGDLSIESADDRVLSPALRRTREDARAYAKASQPPNTSRAYSSDWGHYLDWCQSVDLPSEPANPEVIGLYLAAMANGSIGGVALTVSTIDRRLSALSWTFRQLEQVIDRQDPHIATVLAGIKRVHGRRPAAKEAALTEDLLAMLDTLDLRKLGHIRDKAILLVGFAGGLRRSEVVGLDVGPGQSADTDETCKGWVEFYKKGIVLKLKSKTGFREVEIGLGTTEATCPAAALKSWMTLGRIAHGPIFRRVFEGRREVGVNRLCDDQVALIVKRTVERAGVGGQLPEGDRVMGYAGHSLRSGLASSADIEEGMMQKHLGHADVKMTRQYQRRRERFRVNLTKASGL